MLDKGGSILGLKARVWKVPHASLCGWALWLTLVPLALEVVGCNGGLRPVEWSELGTPRRVREPARQTPPERWSESDARSQVREPAPQAPSGRWSEPDTRLPARDSARQDARDTRWSEPQPRAQAREEALENPPERWSDSDLRPPVRDSARDNPPEIKPSRPPSRPSRQSRPARTSELRLVPRSNREVARLNADDVVLIMQRVGFSDDQILQLGTELHDALLSSGAADFYYGKQKEMIFAVNNQQVYVQSRSRGTFVYDIPEGRFLLGGSQRGTRR